MPLRTLVVALLGATLVTALATAGPVAARPESRPIVTYTIPGDAVFPEGVAAEPRTGYFYVSSTTDGTIFRGHVRKPSLEVFLPGGADGRTSATGLKVDRRGRLFVSGAATGQMWVYDTHSRALLGHFDTGNGAASFINDVTVTPNGDAFFTDSLIPVLYRVPASALLQPSSAVRAPEVFIDFTGTAVVYQAGFNLNGIASTADGHHLVTIQSNTGQLFRIDVGSRDVAEIPVEGGPLTAGDGILLQGRRLLVVRNQLELIVTVALDGELAGGRVVAGFTDQALQFPTTIARLRDRLLVVNSQFDRRGPGLTPELPFTVAGVPVQLVTG
ncbi:MAG TPA: superoxide dismutase [Actinomycetes bacterium]|jgi:Cu-Zn family superoxide dismutase|nr:superoxide dismutase [Actinomycetes bacterium]